MCRCEAIEKSLHQTTLATQGDDLSLAFVQKSDGRLVGQMNAMYVSEKDQCGEIGHVVNPTYSGQGFATEASRVLVSAMFDAKEFRRVIASFDDRNVASRAVVEKLGFREEVHFIGGNFLKGEWVNTVVYATLRDEWYKQQGSRSRSERPLVPPNHFEGQLVKRDESTRTSKVCRGVDPRHSVT